MAPDSSNRPPDDAVEAAIMRVLEAEASAQDAVARARLEATHIAERSREEARGLRLVTDRRLRVVRTAFETQCATEVAALGAEAAALDVAHDLTPTEVSSIERAVASLAHTLTEDRQ
jgi:hypothetical protein